MPVLLTILAVITGLGIWYWRVQAAQQAASDLLDVGRDVRAAARRFGFKRQTNVHPADSIDDPRLAGAGIVAAVASLAGPPNEDQRRSMLLQFQSKFGCDRATAEEYLTFGLWVASECGTMAEGVRRLTRRLAGLAGADAKPDLLEMIDKVAAVRDGMGEEETDAVNTINRILT